MRKRGRTSEISEQVAGLLYMRGQYREFFLCTTHVPNGGYRTKSEARQFQAAGVKRGYPDLLIDLPRCGYMGARIEHKRGKTHEHRSGSLSVDQKQWLARLSSRGYWCAVTYGIDALMKAIDTYCSDLLYEEEWSNEVREFR